ncbi:CIC11C00000002324 [Sungouiella intermedia]|uniref:DNA-directed RNA polymerase III subunit n=1 Tax=Sungouiella intermedia TaxID=45354 RepID=A0A1L0G8F3_9ASCO|nr:CIC11C00000002324 [[Candida] intermedia]SGZ52733.1 CIC11C00000005323 [[Candida] intermedia]
MSFRNKSSGRVLLPFGLDYSDVLSQGQATEKPRLELPVHGPLAPYEQNAAKQAVAFAKLMYDGPFYTGSPEDEGVSSSADSIQRYSDRYKKVKKVGRSIDEYPYQLEFFPEELYSVMGISKKKKKLLLSSYKVDGGLTEFNGNEAEDTAQSMLEKLKSLAEDLDADPSQQNEEEAEEDDFDDEFEEDDDDDYNAEKYFDGGDDDMGDDGDDEAAF